MLNDDLAVTDESIKTQKAAVRQQDQNIELKVAEYLAPLMNLRSIVVNFINASRGNRFGDNLEAIAQDIERLLGQAGEGPANKRQRLNVTGGTTSGRLMIGHANPEKGRARDAAMEDEVD